MKNLFGSRKPIFSVSKHNSFTKTSSCRYRRTICL